MAAFSGKTQNINTSSGTLERKWDALIPYAQKSDYRELAYTLLEGALDTDFHDEARNRTIDWLSGLQAIRKAALYRKDRAALMENIPQPYKLMLSLLGSDRGAFIGKLFSVDTTLYVLSNDQADDICVVSKDPTAKNIYGYNAIYTDALSSGDGFFEFFVCREQKAQYKQHNIKITKGDWDAFNR